MSVIKAYILKKSGLQHIVGGSFVCRYRHVVNDGDTQKRLYVGIVRLRLQRVPEKYYRIYFALRDVRPYLMIAAERTAQKSAHF